MVEKKGTPPYKKKRKIKRKDEKDKNCGISKKNGVPNNPWK